MALQGKTPCLSHGVGIGAEGARGSFEVTGQEKLVLPGSMKENYNSDNHTVNEILGRKLPQRENFAALLLL